MNRHVHGCACHGSHFGQFPRATKGVQKLKAKARAGARSTPTSW
jgi:hypothetical protein